MTCLRWLRGVGVCAVVLSFGALACGGIATTKGPDRRALLCEDGELRLTEETCGSGERLVEECQGEVWHQTGECRAPDDCEEGSVVETGEQCGDYFFNRRLVRCAGGLLQDACSCGAENPNDDVPRYIESQAHANAYRGKTFPARVAFLPEVDVGEISGLEHVRCSGALTTGGQSPPLPHLEGIDSWVALSGSAGFDHIDTVGSLSIWNWEELDEPPSGFSALREVRGILDISSSFKTFDRGFESLRRVGELFIGIIHYHPEAQRLESIDALSGLEVIDGPLTFQIYIEDLSGLRNLRTIGGDLVLMFGSDQIGFAPVDRVSEHLRAFENLEDVGGSVHVGRVTDDAVCMVANFFRQKSIGGAVRVNSREVTLVECNE